MFCKNCGKALPKGSDNCPDCGCRVSSNESSLVIPGIIVAAVLLIGTAILVFKDLKKDGEISVQNPSASVTSTSSTQSVSGMIDSASGDNEEIIIESSETTDITIDEKTENKTYEDLEAKEIFYAGQAAFESAGVTGTGTYAVGDNNDMDNIIRENSSLVGNYSTIAFYLDKGEVLSVYCYNSNEGKIRIESYPLPYTEDNLFSNLSPLYLAMDNEGKQRFNDNEASTFGIALLKALEKISTIADGEYSLADCPSELYDGISKEMDISRFLEYENVNFSIDTIEGEFYISTDVSVDGNVTGTFPNGSLSIGDYIG